MMLDPFVDGRNGVAGVGGPAFGFAAERESVPEEIARDSIGAATRSRFLCVVAFSTENRKFTFPENALIATTAAPSGSG
jgi:hypothetical protein